MTVYITVHIIRVPYCQSAVRLGHDYDSLSRSALRGQVDRLSLLGQARLPRPGVHSRGRQVSTLPDSPTWMGRGSEVTGGGTRPPLRREACLACEIGGASCALCAGALP